ncbi:putative aminoacrylate hydrolase RutD isoform X1 [Lolium rigidum]|uniref:putative aminoacrylate hydrolase RutD isoform X1 n=1 Tax=Lolium rigidum TaxID=89674 RepID=UPI001F5D72F4|nr:putative aminoacrylate hydrolase RutD isoform X1 [Lolium rigidum]
MPYCEVDRYQSGDKWEGVRLFYRRYGRGATKVLLVVGLAGTHDSWGLQIKGLTGSVEPTDEDSSAAGAAPRTDEEAGTGAAAADDDGEGPGIEVCAFDNRGVGRSSILPHKSSYSTAIMARDALAVMDHLGWKKAHVFGHSMGAMISCKLAAIAPHRICSLGLLNVTGGGLECLPKVDGQMLSLAFRFLRAKTPEERAHVDLETHYTKEYLDEKLESCTRRAILYKEYVKNISASGMQSSCGFEGQVNACWTHKLTTKELDTIRGAGFLVSVIHGRSDIIAQLCHAKRLADRLLPAARMVDLQGAHLVSHERPEEVNNAMMDLIKATKSAMKPHEWSSQPENTSETGALISARSVTLTIRKDEAGNAAVAVYNFLAKFQLSFLYLIGLIVMGFEHMRNIVRVMKPVRVAAIES